MLFGALIGLQATAFVSCKDYDDDIAALRNEITTNATDLKSLVDEKMKNVEAEISALKSQSSALEEAYKKADKVLEDAIATATNDAKGYADVQAAEAQKAAVASAKTMVDNAVAKLEAGLDAANKRIDENGNNIAGLIAANVTLTEGVQAAQKRADEAYALAETAKKLADAAQAAAEAAQEAADKAQGSADAANEAAAANAELIGELKTALEGITTEMGEVKATLGTMAEQISTLEGEFTAKIAELEAQLTDYESQYAKLSDLQDSYNKLAEMISAGDAELKGLADANKNEIDALKQTLDNFKAEAVESALTDAKEYTEAQIGVLQAEIVSKIASANEALSTSFATELATLKSDLEALIGLNTSGVAANKAEIGKLAGKIGDNAIAIANNATAIGNNAAAIAAANTKISNVETAYKAADDAIKGLITALDTRVATLEGKVSTLEAQLSKINPYLEDNLNNMITSLIVQDQKQQFVYGKVLSTINAGFAVGGTTRTYTKVEGNQTVVYFPYIGATNAKGDLIGGQYNVEKNGGLVYFTINPTNVNFEDNANIQMENSLGQAPKTATGEIAVGAPKNAANHLITRAANVENKNGLYSARLTFTNTDKTKAPENFKNSYALYTKYNTYANDEEGNKVATEKRVYSKYEVNLSFTQAYGYVTGEMVAVGDNFDTTMPGVDYKFVSKFGDPMTGVLDLKPVTAANDNNWKKAFRKYVEIVAVKNTRNEVLTGNNLKAVIEKMTAANPEALQKVLEEPAGEPQNVEVQANGFDRITLNMPYEEYKGYKFTLNYYVQSYTGNVTASQKVIMFAQPLFECNLIHVKHTPTSAAMQESDSKETEFLASACLTNLDKWAKNTSKIVVTFDKEDKANINDVKFYDNEANQALIAKASTGEAWVFENLTEATIKKFKNLTIEYNPAKLKVEHPYMITLTSYDLNGNEVCIQDVEFTMTHPTACNGLIQPNPLFFDPFNKELTELSEAYTLTAWAMHSRNQDGYYGYYNVITAFNEYKDKHGCVLRFDIQADKKAGYEAAGEFAALKPISQYPFRPILDWGDESTWKAAYMMQAPVTALEYGKEHVYPMCVGVEYYGVSSLWYDNQKFNLVFKSPIAWTEAKFAKAFNIGYPSKSITITDADITADDPSTSIVDDIKYFGTEKDQRINGDVKVELVETQFRSIFETIEVTDGGITIKTAENVYGGVGSIEGQEIHFNMLVKDYFGNTRKYPFTVVLANND